MKSKNTYKILPLFLLCTSCMTPPVSEKQPTFSLGESWNHQVTKEPLSLEPSYSQEKWWEIFNDPQLNALVEEGLQNSPSIDLSLSRFEESMWYSKVVGADQFPQLSLNGYGDRRRIPKSLQASATVPTGNFITPTTPAPIPVPNTGVPPIVIPAIPEMQTVRTPLLVNDLIANFLVSYELDFWGKYYLRTEATKRRAEASEADLETAKLLLVDQIASTYFAIQALQEELSLILEEIDVHENRLTLLKNQCDKGLTTSFELLQEQATLESKKTEEQALIKSKEVNTSLLAILIGREPNQASLDIGNALWQYPIVPPGLPSSLLAKRPDVRSRMKEVDAKIAEIGVAKTELLPAISLSAAAGYQGPFANDWFKWKNRIWSLAASISQPIFDAGQRFAEVEVRKAQFHEAAANLTQTVLNSVKEVEDALIAIKTQEERKASAIKREQDLSEVATLRYDLYAKGIRDYISFLQAEEDLIQTERATIDEEFNLQLATLALLKSLGGKWN